MQTPIFGISGMRGIVGESLLPDAVSRTAAAFGTFVGHGTVVVGRDTRSSGEMMLGATVAGLLSVGCEVIDLGLCPTPTVLHHARRNPVAGGIVLTASHNPEQWNGMKFVNREGEFLSAEDIAALRKLVKSGASKYAEWNAVRPVRQNANATYAHINAVVSNELFRGTRAAIIERKMKVAIDAVNGAASIAAAQLVESLGAEPVRLNCSCEPQQACAGFPRRPEPTPANIGDLCGLVRERKLSFGLAFDPDGDRLSAVDDTGTPLGEEATILLACRHVLPKRPGPVVVNLSTTRGVEDVCGEFSAPVERTPVGEVSVVRRMKEVNAVLGGEGNGGVILPEVNFTRDALVGAAAIFGQVAERKEPLSAIAATLPRYYIVKKSVELGRDGFSERAAAVVAAFPDSKVDRQDGLRIDTADFWVHVRPSNTEPIVRIIAEAKTKGAAEQAAERAGAALADVRKEKG